MNGLLWLLRGEETDGNKGGNREISWAPMVQVNSDVDLDVVGGSDRLGEEVWSIRWQGWHFQTPDTFLKAECSCPYFSVSQLPGPWAMSPSVVVSEASAVLPFFQRPFRSICSLGTCAPWQAPLETIAAPCQQMFLLLSSISSTFLEKLTLWKQRPLSLTNFLLIESEQHLSP